MLLSIDTMWVLLCAALIFFMQAGFAMLEAGFIRAKNAGNIIMKNFVDFCIGSLVFWILGFSLMFGATHFGLIGTPDFFVKGDYSSSIPTMAFLIFQTMFCGAAATIVSGAMAERTKFISYCIFSVAISAVIYPISGHWIWGGGWLQQLGFHDFAGSTAIHTVGGISALIGAKMLGPRIGKYTKDGKPNAIPGHSLTLGALGVFILWFGWFGFNGGSTLTATGNDAITLISHIFVTTNLAAAAGAVSTMLISWVRYKKPDMSMTLNGALGGLVAITASCDMVSPVGAAMIGIIAGFIIVFGIEFVDKVLKIDDPVGAVGVHAFCGMGGTIMTGLFAVEGGLFYGGGFHFLGLQLLGVLSVALWTACSILIVFIIIKKTVGLRVSEAEEISGLDISQHGLDSCYADFVPVPPEYLGLLDGLNDVDMDTAVPVEFKTERPNKGNVKMTKVEIITKQSKFELLNEAMHKIGVTGMTVTNVLGCGMQKGHSEYYRGVPMHADLLPKIKVEIVVCKVPVRALIETAKKVLYTGKIGDGKIFVYDVESVIKVRTGEEDFDALQDNV